MPLNSFMIDFNMIFPVLQIEANFMKCAMDSEAQCRALRYQDAIEVSSVRHGNVT